MKAILVILLILCLLIGCKSDSKTSEPTGPQGSPPLEPSFYRVTAIVQEPIRGMYLEIYDASDNEDGFIIERKIEGEPFTQLVNLSANTKTYDDWNLKMSTKYTYRIKAYNQHGSSVWSEKTQTSAGQVPGQVFFYPEADSYVRESSPSINYGSEGYLLVDGDYNDPGQKMFSYIKFDLQKYIPNYAIDIDKAELRLICQTASELGTPLITAHEIESSWNEYSVNWNNRPNFSIIALGLGTRVFHDGKPVYLNITYFVRDWLEGKILNYGVALHARNSISRAVLFSRERNQIKPMLTVDYYW